MVNSKDELIYDSLILLPALGFPAIAEFNKKKNAYEIFVSMVVKRKPSESRGTLSYYLSKKENIDKFAKEICQYIKIKEFESGKNSDLKIKDMQVLRIAKIEEKVEEKYYVGFISSSRKAYLKDIYCSNGYKRVFWLPPSEIFIIRLMKEFAGIKTLCLPGVQSNECENVLLVEGILTIGSNISSKNSSGKLYNLISEYEQKDPYKSFMKRMIKNISKKIENYDERIPLDDIITAYHPICIFPPNKKFLNVAHISDTHVSRRWDAMEHWAERRANDAKKILKNKNEYFKDTDLNLQIDIKKCFPEKGTPWDKFNNPNKRFEDALKKANENPDVDIIIITGDLIDYNLGYYGDPENKAHYFKHGEESYFPNYNWTRFYEILIKNYKKPVFTILGNHDYRLAPYGIVTEGKKSIKGIPTPTPIPSFPTSNIQPIEIPLPGTQNFADDLGIEVKKGKKLKLKCQRNAVNFIYSKKMTESFKWWIELATDYKHVEWYNLVINPALDYMFTYKNMYFLFFDWHEKERLCEVKMFDFEIYKTPWAANVLTDGQKDMLRKTIEAMKSGTDNKDAKILVISMHPTVFCEPKQDLTGGNIVKDKDRRADEPEHLALGNFEEGRCWFIQTLWDFVRNKKAKVIILSGHAHKNRVYFIPEDNIKYKKNAKCELESSAVSTLIGVTESSVLTNYTQTSPIFIVTTSSAYVSSEQASPGFRILKFDDEKVITKLVSLLTSDKDAVKKVLIQKS